VGSREPRTADDQEGHSSGALTRFFGAGTELGPELAWYSKVQV
jgi:hypothetical protein